MEINTLPDVNQKTSSNTSEMVKSMMEGDKQTEQEQTKSDTIATQSNPKEAVEIHKTSTKERTKRTIHRVWGAVVLVTVTIVSTTVVIIKTMAKNSNTKA